ncbi:NAD(P)/FAD-dependent oxidoreductase [Saccharicrinis fermentans]|uniref:Putidaredoxin reductase n=1 Tax=Saccharicrinis fermentans DSM 9555 = JCM 21142 TaxID=869213 RepID=W7XW12_9BACT|nr:FAD-dependent oxidoreductase [Saccharicrinis fermentans]GAF02455.1 putidaredoxin reductase [Saccharicrinis fermentans DSM 9555 = JCM 21142]
MDTSNLKCVIIGASQAGVSCAFALREEGWKGEIRLFDADSKCPYSRPPLSKGALTGKDNMDDHVLKPLHLYQKENIHLHLGSKVVSLDPIDNQIVLSNQAVYEFDNLVLATGARAFVPPIPGIDSVEKVFVLRTQSDAENIRREVSHSTDKEVLIIGGGYIGLETASSLSAMGARVTVLEREQRILERVTAPVMSAFFMHLHTRHKVDIKLNKNVVSVDQEDKCRVVCEDGSTYQADIIVVGVGVMVNTELAEQAAIKVDNGIWVNSSMQTSRKNIYAIGDCTRHYNPFYDRYIRLESVQNANDQAKIAAASLCGNKGVYDVLPWFWSDQYDVKLQIVGLSEGYDNLVVRHEDGKENAFSVWYFHKEQLLAVDAVNNAKAYMIGAKFIRQKIGVDKNKLGDSRIPLKPTNLLKE